MVRGERLTALARLFRFNSARSSTAATEAAAFAPLFSLGSLIMRQQTHVCAPGIKATRPLAAPWLLAFLRPVFPRKFLGKLEAPAFADSYNRRWLPSVEIQLADRSINGLPITPQGLHADGRNYTSDHFIPHQPERVTDPTVSENCSEKV